MKKFLAIICAGVLALGTGAGFSVEAKVKKSTKKITKKEKVVTAKKAAKADADLKVIKTDQACEKKCEGKAECKEMKATEVKFQKADSKDVKRLQKVDKKFVKKADCKKEAEHKCDKKGHECNGHECEKGTEHKCVKKGHECTGHECEKGTDHKCEHEKK